MFEQWFIGALSGIDFHHSGRARWKHADGTVEENHGKKFPKCSTIAEELAKGTSGVAEAKSLKASDDEDRRHRNSLEKATKI